MHVSACHRDAQRLGGFARFARNARPTKMVAARPRSARAPKARETEDAREARILAGPIGLPCRLPTGDLWFILAAKMSKTEPPKATRSEAPKGPSVAIKSTNTKLNPKPA